MSRVVLGFRAHSGWAAMVALEGGMAAPRVILRRRLDLLDRGIQGAAQPYHTAAEMALADAEEFLEGCRVATRAAAEHAVRSVLGEISKKGYQATAACVLLSSGRPVPSLTAVLRSHPMLHTAEGEFYREALKTACAACDVPVSGVKEKDLAGAAALVLGSTPGELERRIGDLGKLIGPPWRQDEKLSAMGAWIVLAGQSQR